MLDFLNHNLDKFNLSNLSPLMFINIQYQFKFINNQSHEHTRYKIENHLLSFYRYEKLQVYRSLDQSIKYERKIYNFISFRSYYLMRFIPINIYTSS